MLLSENKKQQLEQIVQSCIKKYSNIHISIHDSGDNTYISISPNEDPTLPSDFYDEAFRQANSALFFVNRIIKVDDKYFNNRVSLMKEHCQDLTVLLDAGKYFNSADQLHYDTYRLDEVQFLRQRYRDANNLKAIAGFRSGARCDIIDTLSPRQKILKSKWLFNKWIDYKRSDRYPDAGRIKNIIGFIFQKRCKVSKSTLRTSAKDPDLVLIDVPGFQYKSFKKTAKENGILFAKVRTINKNYGYSRKLAKLWDAEGDYHPFAKPCTDKQFQEHMAKNFSEVGFRARKMMDPCKTSTVQLYVKKLDAPVANKIKFQLKYNYALQNSNIESKVSKFVNLSEQQFERWCEHAKDMLIDFSIPTQYEEEGITIAVSSGQSETLNCFIMNELNKGGIDDVLLKERNWKDPDTYKKPEHKIYEGNGIRIEQNNPIELAKSEEMLRRFREAEEREI